MGQPEPEVLCLGYPKNLMPHPYHYLYPFHQLFFTFKDLSCLANIIVTVCGMFAMSVF